MSFVIKPIPSSNTLPLRHKVLWPDHPIAQSQLDGDDTALHFGGFLHGQLVSVASLFETDNGLRLRKFATDQEFQGRGLGSAMLIYLLNVAKASKATLLWFDARETARPLYERHGFITQGDRFFKNDIPYFRMFQKLTDV